jgi:hypothetical protein
MKKKLLSMVSVLCCLILFAGTVFAAEEKSVEQKDIEKVVNALKGTKFGFLSYLSYQNGADKGNGYSQFAAKRGYFRFTKDFMPSYSGHVTFDITQIKDEAKDTAGKTSNYDGSVAVRIKYLYGKFNLPDMAFLTKPFVEAGIVHMPWLDFEEHINFYRCQDTMFIERNGTFNSADIGVTFVTLFGGTLDEAYQKDVSSYYPGRYGSASFGVYNGGGYHAAEKNMNKSLEGRLTVRPLPDIIPGLQVSYFGIFGKGNTAAMPDWKANLGFVSYEHKYVAVTGQYYKGDGTQKGDAVDKNGKALERDGYSVFAEIKPDKKFSIIGRYDAFDPDTKTADDGNTRYIVGAAYHIDKQHKNMLVLDYDTVDYEKAGVKDDKRIQLTLQVAL